MVVQELESQLWSAELLQPARIEQGGKDYESALESQECFLKENCKGKRDGTNLSC